MDPYIEFAPLFCYPDDQYAARARTCAEACAAPALHAFADAVCDLPTTVLQERFIEAFDLNPAAALEIGWHIFGEQYERGDFLVMLRQQLRAAGIAETVELPDHLLHVLPLIAHMNAAEREAFVRRYLGPALEKIAAAVPDKSPFADLVRATLEICGSGSQQPRDIHTEAGSTEAGVLSASRASAVSSPERQGGAAHD